MKKKLQNIYSDFETQPIKISYSFEIFGDVILIVIHITAYQICLIKSASLQIRVRKIRSFGNYLRSNIHESSIEEFAVERYFSFFIKNSDFFCVNLISKFVMNIRTCVKSFPLYFWLEKSCPVISKLA